MKKIWETYRSAFFAFLAIVFLYLLFFLCGITCPIKFLFGVSCPGCGMTRAWLHALCFDFGGAFYYHPLWVTLPLFGGGYLLLDHKGRGRLARVLVWVFVGLMLGIYLLRLLLPSGDVVIFAPHEGLVYRVIRHVYSLFG